MKNSVCICMGSSCFARGNEQNLKILEGFIEKHALNIDVELSGSRCEAQCIDGPNIQINGVIYNKIDSGSLIDLLNQHLLEKK